MNLALAREQTVVSRLRLHISSGDSLLLGLRASRALSSLSLDSSALSAGLLIVRRFADPLPGRLSLTGADSRLPAEWEQAARSQMAALTRRACRPLHGWVPENAEAVLFADHGELLACLARDWLRGETRHWWWRTLFAQGDLAAAVVRLSIERADCFPAAVVHLARSGEDLSLVSSLRPEVVGQLMQALLGKHGLYGLSAALEPLWRPARPGNVGDPRTDVVVPHEAAEGADGPSPDEARTVAPWSRYLQNHATGARLPPLSGALRGLCHALVASPQATRTAAFAAQAGRWAVAVLDGARSSGDPARTAAAPEGPPLARSRVHAQRATAAAGQTGLGSGPLKNAEPGVAEATPMVRSRALVGADPVLGSIGAAVIEVPPAAREPRRSVETARGPGPLTAGTRPFGMQECCIDSRFGGVLLLLNVGLFLGLYGDFTQPERSGIELPIWDFAALVGEDLLGPALRADPLWALMAELSGRQTAQRPGCGFHGERDWRIPVRWLHPARAIAAGVPSCSGGRLRIVHPAGFVLLDVARRGETPGRQLARELSRFVGQGALDGAQRRRLLAALPCRPGRIRNFARPARRSRWLGWLLSFVRHRLRQSLGVSSDEATADLLLRRRGRVLVTPTQLDVRFALAELPVALRLSGLDRNPGWVPAAGRSIYFHFD